MMTYSNLYLEIRQRLKDEKIQAYALEARELVCHSAGKTKEEFAACQALYMDEKTEQRVRWALKQRLEGEPLAQILGEWDFYGLTFEVNGSVLIPRADTETLAERAIAYMRPLGDSGRLLDLCTGSGCIGIAVAAHVPQCRVVLVDISDEALGICKRNAAFNGVGGSALILKADAMKSPPAYIGKFDVMTCNPPYISQNEYEQLDRSVRDYEPRLALFGGVDGLDFYRAISRNWKSVLRAGGKLLFEVGDTQAMQVSDIMDSRGFKIIEILKDTGGHDRVVVGELITDKEI